MGRVGRLEVFRAQPFSGSSWRLKGKDWGGGWSVSERALARAYFQDQGDNAAQSAQGHWLVQLGLYKLATSVGRPPPL